MKEDVTWLTAGMMNGEVRRFTDIINEDMRKLNRERISQQQIIKAEKEKRKAKAKQKADKQTKKRIRKQSRK